MKIMGNQLTIFRIVAFSILLLISSNINAQHLSVSNIAGNGTNEYTADQLALETGFQPPAALAEDSDGNIYFTVSAFFGGVAGIFKIDIATGELSNFHNPGFGVNGIAIDEGDTVYFCRSSATDERYIQYITPDGELDTLAGNGDEIVEFPIDGALALGQPIANAAGLKIGPDGEYLYYSGFGSSVNIIQRINLATNVTERVAGWGGSAAADIPNGSPASSTLLNVGVGLAWDSEDNLYYGTRDFRIMKIKSSDNTVWNVIGTGESGFSGDGDLAAVAQIFIAESGFAITDEDELLFCDTGNNRIRKVTLYPNGDGDEVVETICGTGYEEGDVESPDGDLLNGQFKLPLETNAQPSDIMILESGEGLVFSDLGKNRVRTIKPCTNPTINTLSIDNDAVCSGDIVTMSFTGDLGDAEIWNWYEGSCDLSGVSLGSSASLTITASETTTYHVIGTGGCTNIEDCKEFAIEVSCTDYFNTFTPNDDGKNEFLEIPVLENYPNNTVIIYNRWGDLLKQIENYDNSSQVWRGTYGDDDKVDSGTYYFTAVAGGELITSGWIEVIK